LSSPVFLPAILATKELKKYCGELAVGTSAAAVKLQAESRGYRLWQMVDGRTMIDDPGSFGRPSCNVRFGPQGLEAVEFSTND
jgi:hypothetical protein